METKVFLKSPAVCRAMTRLNDYNTASMICAHDENTDACMVKFSFLAHRFYDLKKILRQIYLKISG